MRISDWSSDVCSSDLDHRKSSDEEGWLHPLSLGFAGLLRGPAADSDASSEGRTRHGSNPFSTYSGPPRLGLARRCHAPTGNGSQTTGAAHAACRGGGRAFDRQQSRSLCATGAAARSEEPTSEPQSLLRTSYAVFCLKKKNNHITQ